MRPQDDGKFAVQVALRVGGLAVMKDTSRADEEDFMTVLGGKTPANIVQPGDINDIEFSTIGMRHRHDVDPLALLDNTNPRRQVAKPDEETVVLGPLSKVGKAQRDIVGDELQYFVKGGRGSRTVAIRALDLHGAFRTHRR